MDNFGIRIGLFIKKIRIEQGLKQIDLADLSNISRDHIVNIEQNKKSVTLKNLEYILSALGYNIRDAVNIAYSFSEEDMLQIQNMHLLRRKNQDTTLPKALPKTQSKYVPFDINTISKDELVTIVSELYDFNLQNQVKIADIITEFKHDK